MGKITVLLEDQYLLSDTSTDKRDTRVTQIARHVKAPDAFADLLGLGRTAHSAVRLHAVRLHAVRRHAVDRHAVGHQAVDSNKFRVILRYDNQAGNPHEFLWP